MRIYDTIIFDNETDLLEYRLREIYDLVDVIVLTEAAQTFQGDSKPLNFRAAQNRFEWALPKLRHVALPALPGATTWEREAFQRNAIQLGLYDAKDDDLVLVLDADEVPSRSVLERLRSGGVSRPHRLLMTRHYGRYDRLAPRSACCVNPNDPFPFSIPHLFPGSWDDLKPTWWCMPGVVVRFKDIVGDPLTALPARTPHTLRREDQSAPRLPEAGRHLSSVFSAEELKIKLSHYSHSEHAGECSLSLEHLSRARECSVHARGWWYAERPKGTLPSDLQRLEAQLGTKASPVGEQGRVRRKLVRTWAWLRHVEWIPRGATDFVDRNFERLTFFLVPFLLPIDSVRSLVAAWQRREHRMQSTAH